MRCRKLPIGFCSACGEYKPVVVVGDVLLCMSCKDNGHTKIKHRLKKYGHFNADGQSFK